MNRNNIVFVFGAGVSMDYGYPSGNKLRELILIRAQEYITGKGMANGYIPSTSFSNSDVKHFRDSFLRSGSSSIDSFRCDR